MFRQSNVNDMVFCTCEETWVNPKNGYGCVPKCPMSGTLNCVTEREKKNDE